MAVSAEAVARYERASPLLLALEDGKLTLPPGDFFNADENTVSVGRAGLNE